MVKTKKKAFYIFIKANPIMGKKYEWFWLKDICRGGKGITAFCHLLIKYLAFSSAESPIASRFWSSRHGNNSCKHQSIHGLSAAKFNQFLLNKFKKYYLADQRVLVSEMPSVEFGCIAGGVFNFDAHFVPGFCQLHLFMVPLNWWDISQQYNLK